MSKTAITLERVNEVLPHPNADRLDIVQVLGYRVVVQKGKFKVGDTGVYFPPDILIPQNVAEDLGVAAYLKHAVYPGDDVKSQCRVGACRLRGSPSYGFLLKTEGGSFGADVTSMYAGKKYLPPVRVLGGDMLPEHPLFHRYTDIENIQRFPGVFKRGEDVVITEKIHGTNSRIGHIDGELMAGSHNTRRVKDMETLYWKPAQLVRSLLLSFKHNVIIFGEIYGQGIQDLDYGCDVPAYRAFDMSVDGHYLSKYDFFDLCKSFNVPTVKVLAVGAYSADAVNKFTHGPTMSGQGDIRCKFKGREGCVITPRMESYSDILGGRKILKSVSADYLGRKGGTDHD